jgi:2-C-methyl-D-erythritol 4-phosphate cytidylyltransferase
VTKGGVIAIILAGGVGERFDNKIPKQFVKIAGREIIEFTIDVFEKSSHVNDIVVVSRGEFEDHIWALAQQNGWSKLSSVVHAGSDRFGSTESAIRALAGKDEGQRILIHDAVRPLLDQATIERCIQALEHHEAVDVVIPSTDTLVAVDEDAVITSIPDRTFMRRGQTPQAFHLKTIIAAYDHARAAGLRGFTCDCGVVRAMLPNVKIKSVMGAETNIKITTPLDLFIAEKLLQSRGFKPDTTELTHLAGKRIVVFGGSSGIGEAVVRIADANGAYTHVASRSASNVDVGEYDSVQQFLADVSKQHGPIDAVINSAGVLIRRPIAQMSISDVNHLIKANYSGAVNVAMAARPFLGATKGMLVNFTSSSYTRGRANYAVYSSTKCAVVNLTQALAEEWVPIGIRVNCINPQRTRTPMRVENFGLEDPGTLLSAEDVAKHTLATLISNQTGMIIDIKLERAR